MARGKAKGSGKAANDKEKDKDKKVDACACPKKCVKDRVDCVYCEGCSSWFHCPCVKVDRKRASDPDFIFHCEFTCKPLKIKEFNECKEKLIANIDELSKAHPTFSTAKLAQKCFVNKTK